MCCPPLCAYRRHTTVLLMALSVAEIEQVEEVANGTHVGWHVRIVIVKLGIGQIVAAAVAERCIEHPVPFNELDEDGGLGPLPWVALRELDDVFSEGLKEPPLGRSRVAVQRAVRLNVGDRR